MVFHLYAFGSNGEGQLGLGFASDKVLTPTLVTKPEPQSKKPWYYGKLWAIRGGGNHTLLLAPNAGTVYGAGSNEHGQLQKKGHSCCGSAATSDNENRRLEFKALCNGFHHCAATWESSAYIENIHYSDLEPNGGALVYTEGRGSHGELGRGHVKQVYNERIYPQEYTGFTCLDVLPTRLPAQVRCLAAGMYHYVAVLWNGEVWGWGRARNGQLGKTDQRCYTTPTRIPDIPFSAHKVVCGKDFTYIVGDPASGEHIVLGEDKHCIQSKALPNVKNWKDIGATWNAIFVLFKDGTLKAWGKEDLWQLVPPYFVIKEIAVGSDHVLAMDYEGKVLSWGWAAHGNCGDTGNLRKPLVKGYVTGQYNGMEFPGKVVQIGAGYSTSFVMTWEDDGDEKEDG